MGGIAAAVRLRARGAHVTIYERATALGGVWRDNRYPGAECDVPSFLYSFSFAPKSDWSRSYAGQAEILRYLNDTAASFDLLEHMRFDHELNAATWLDEESQWRLTFANLHTTQVDMVVYACGQMSTPAVPPVVGAELFEGRAVHTARWPDDLDLVGKKVLVVGAGASVIQVVPEIAAVAAQVTILQRSPGYVLAKDNGPAPQNQSRLATKWRRYRSYWSKELRTPRLIRWPRLVRGPERRFRQELSTWVPESRLHEVVEPRDRYGCKRILVSNAWYPALRRQNVEVREETLERLEADGAVTRSGERILADVIVYGTGFHTTRFLDGIDVRGRGDERLTDVWRGEPYAYLGITVPGFPNMFLLYGPNTNPAWNSVLFMLEAQATFVAQMAVRWQRTGGASIEATQQATERFREQMDRKSARSIWMTGCTNWYLSARGRNTQNWPSLATTYWWRTHWIRWSDLTIRATTR